MSSHFVSGGTILPGSEEGTKDAPGPSSIAAAAPREQLSSKNIEWEAVEKELEADRKRREEQRLKTATGEEKSLYDILQANKGLFFASLAYLFCLTFTPRYDEKARLSCISLSSWHLTWKLTSWSFGICSREARSVRGTKQDTEPVPRSR